MRFFYRAIPFAPRTSFALVCGVTLLLSGCGGGAGNGATGGSTPTATEIYTIQYPSPSAPNQDNLILSFNSNDSGAVSPDATLTLPTNFYAFATAIDKTGNLYIVGSLAGTTPEVLVYTAGSSGSATPARVLSGPQTQMTDAETIAVDNTGLLYVLTSGGTVNVYATAANGNVAPMRSFTGGPDTGTSIAVDSSGNTYVGGFIDPIVRVYGPTATGTVTPIRTLTGSSTELGDILQLAIDSSNQLYVASTTVEQAVLIFASGANGNTAPVRTIQGSLTGIVSLNMTGVAVDSSGQIYEAQVTNFADLTGPSLNIFPATATGNVAPSKHITSTVWTQTGQGSTLSVF